MSAARRTDSGLLTAHRQTPTTKPVVDVPADCQLGTMDRFTAAEVDRYATCCVSNGQPGDYLELLVVDDEGHEVRRPGTN